MAALRVVVDLGELLRQVASNPAPDLRSVAPRVHPATAALVARLLAKRPGDRPPDGRALVAALQAAMARLPRQPPAPGDPSSKPRVPMHNLPACHSTPRRLPLCP